MGAFIKEYLVWLGLQVGSVEHKIRLGILRNVLSLVNNLIIFGIYYSITYLSIFHSWFGSVDPCYVYKKSRIQVKLNLSTDADSITTAMKRKKLNEGDLFFFQLNFLLKGVQKICVGGPNFFCPRSFGGLKFVFWRGSRNIFLVVGPKIYIYMYIYKFFFCS